jgi:hypothetical protein
MIVPGQMADMSPDAAPSPAAGLSFLSPAASIDGDRGGPDGSPLNSGSGIISYIFLFLF